MQTIGNESLENASSVSKACAGCGSEAIRKFMVVPDNGHLRREDIRLSVYRCGTCDLVFLIRFRRRIWEDATSPMRIRPNIRPRISITTMGSRSASVGSGWMSWKAIRAKWEASRHGLWEGTLRCSGHRSWLDRLGRRARRGRLPSGGFTVPARHDSRRVTRSSRSADALRCDHALGCHRTCAQPC